MGNVGNLETKVNLNDINNPVLKALLALVDQLPLQSKKKAKAPATDALQALSQHLVKFVEVCFPLIVF
jgi:hypothetical protein